MTNPTKCCDAPKLSITWSSEGPEAQPQAVMCGACGAGVDFATWARSIEMQPVVSSNIATIGYSREPAVLRIDYLNGGQYAFVGVDAPQWEGFLAADSKGTYFNRELRGKFKGCKLAPKETV